MALEEGLLPLKRQEGEGEIGREKKGGDGGEEGELHPRLAKKRLGQELLSPTANFTIKLRAILVVQLCPISFILLKKKNLKKKRKKKRKKKIDTCRKRIAYPCRWLGFENQIH